MTAIGDEISDETVEQTPPSDSGKDAELLKEIRDRFRQWSEAWREQREHRAVLMRYLCGDPWDEKDRLAREDARRPCLSHDELNQYVFQCVNSARQSKRGIKIEPAGNGATEKTAELRQDIARTVEYQSKAQSVYLRAYQDEVEGGYGFCRVTRRYVNDDSDDQDIVIKAIPNPDSVIYDPYFKDEDGADARGCFILDPIPRDEFKSRFPNAQITDFGSQEQRTAPDWIQERTVLTAEYWRVEVSTEKRGKRTVEKKRVMQYFTNGIEILERAEEPGKEIPIPIFLGLQRYVNDEGGGSKRRLFALPSFALEPQMSLAYFVSLEAEQAGLTPKTPYKGYVGQFETDKEAWDNITKVPVGYIQADVVVDAAGNPLPLPSREGFVFQSLEVEKESARRAIQAAMGINPLPTAAQRQNEKSGVALQKIQASQEVGSFHFVDGFERAITRVGRIVDAWIPVTYDTRREMWLHQADESRKWTVINDTLPDEEGETATIGDEDHDVTIGTGPSTASQEQASSEFLDLLVSNLEQIPAPGSPQAKLLALAIQMKELGPKGDEIVAILLGEDQSPQAQQQAAQLGQQLQQIHAYAQKLEQDNQKMAFEKQAKVVDNQFQTEREVRLKQMQIDADARKLENAITVAEIQTKAQSIEERMRFIEDQWKQLHQQAHEVAMAAQDQQHAQDLAEQTQEHTQANAQQQADLQPEPEPAQAQQ